MYFDQIFCFLISVSMQQLLNCQLKIYENKPAHTNQLIQTSLYQLAHKQTSSYKQLIETSLHKPTHANQLIQTSSYKPTHKPNGKWNIAAD